MNTLIYNSLWSATIRTYVVHRPHLVEVEELSMDVRDTPPPRRGGRIVDGCQRYPHLVEVEELSMDVRDTPTS